jgi:hypothetical protein
LTTAIRLRRGTARNPARFAVAAALTAVLAVVSGCSTHPAPRPDTTPVTARQREQAQALLIGDAATMRQSWALFGAQQTLVQRCMAEQGLRYLVADPGPEPSAGLTTADVAGTDAPPSYGVTVREQAAQTPPEDQYVASLPPAQRQRYLAALDGPPSGRGTVTLPSGLSATYGTGGCLAQARSALYGSTVAAVRDSLVPQDLDQSLGRYLSRDRTYQSALAAWQRCMVARGLHTSSPAALIASLQSTAGTRISTTAFAKQQSDDATADLSCDARSGLRRTFDRQVGAFLAQQPESTLTLLDEVWQTRQQSAARAAQQA